MTPLDRQAHLRRVQDLVDRALRWCPDATGQDREEAVERLSHESAHARGLAATWEFPSVCGLPRAGVRDLLEAAEAIFAQHIDWDWPSKSQLTHQSGFGLGPDRTCDGCAWWSDSRCAQVDGQADAVPSFGPTSPACARWEAKETIDDCITCGACCREGYTLAPVEADETIGSRHPGLITKDVDGNRHLARPGGLCVALDRSAGPARFPCTVYADRPRACADLLPGSHACLIARRRVGLSR